MQRTLFPLLTQQPEQSKDILEQLGFVRVRHTPEYITLFNTLYGQVDKTLYNNSAIYPFSYLNTGQLELWVNKDAAEWDTIPVVRKYKGSPRYTIHCPSANIEKVVETVERLEQFSVKPVAITDVTEDYVDCFRLLYGSAFDADWEVVKTSDDVIYDAQKVYELKGNKYSSIRNTLRKVERDLNPQLELISTIRHRNDAIQVFNRWKETQGLKYFRVTVGRDIRLIEEYWDKVDEVNHWGFVAYVDGKPCGVSYGCRSPQDTDWGVEVTLKALPSCYGLSDFIRHHLISTLWNNGIAYVNDSDLNYGKGVKNNKLKWQPVEFIKTFDIKRRKH